MENQEHQEFNADAAFNEAANEIESGGLTADDKPPVAEEPNQTTPDQRETSDSQGEAEQSQEQEDVPEWWESATDEVKEYFRKSQEEIKRLDHMAKSQRGRVGALSKKYQQAQAALAQLQTQQPQGELTEAINKISEDYPEVAEVLNKLVSTQQQQLNGISTPIAQIAEANMQDIATQELEVATNYVCRVIPDAKDIVHDPKFDAWLSKQPNGIKALFGSDDPGDAIYLLGEYKKAVANVSATKEQQVKRNQQLSAMSLPSGRNAPKGNDEIDEDALFNQIAEEYRKQESY